MNSIVNDHIIALKKTIHLINKKWTNILHDYQTKKIEFYNETNYGSILSNQFRQFLNQHGQN